MPLYSGPKTFLICLSIECSFVNPFIRLFADSFPFLAVIIRLFNQSGFLHVVVSRLGSSQRIQVVHIVLFDDGVINAHVQRLLKHAFKIQHAGAGSREYRPDDGPLGAFD